MAKDTADTAPQLAPGAAELIALEQARADYKALLEPYQADPSKQVLGGTTNEEYRALKLAQDAKEAAQNAYYLALRGTTDDPFRYNPRVNDETGYFTDAEGNFGLGILPENYYYNDYSGTMVEGTPTYGPQPPVGPGDLTLGGPSEGSPGQVGTQPGPFEPPNNYQPGGGNGLPNGGIPEGYLPDSQGNSYWDYVTNGGTVPNVPGYGGYVQNGPQQSYNSLTNSNLGQGGGAVSGPAAMGTNPLEQYMPDKIGWEQSYNKDFYQDQFQRMRTQENAMNAQRWAAAIRADNASNAAPAEPFGGDPWSWANLPEVQMGTGERTGTTEWQLNPRFDWSPGTTNQQIVQDLNLSGDELSYLTKNPKKWEAAPSVLDQSAFQQFINSSPGDRGYTDTLNKIYQAAWRPTISGEGGPLAPVGYAAPINVQGAA